MKAYKPKSLVAVSRYQNYFPSLAADVQKEVYARMEELIEEEKGYCDKGNYKHMAQIFTSIALYEVLQNHGKTLGCGDDECNFHLMSKERAKELGFVKSPDAK